MGLTEGLKKCHPSLLRLPRLVNKTLASHLLFVPSKISGTFRTCRFGKTTRSSLLRVVGNALLLTTDLPCGSDLPDESPTRPG